MERMGMGLWAVRPWGGVVVVRLLMGAVTVQVLATSSGWGDVPETRWPRPAGQEESGCGAGLGQRDTRHLCGLGLCASTYFLGCEIPLQKITFLLF